MTRARLLALPGLLWLTIFLVVPCAIVLTYSFFLRGIYGGIEWTFTFENYVRAVDPLYLGIIARSARVAATASLIALVIAFPAAYAIARQPLRRQTPLLFLIMLPFWSNYLIRTYAWIVLLNREGLINQGLSGVGLTSEPINLLYNEFAVVLGLVYNYVPFVILAIYASLQRLDPALTEASEDLGASRWATFRHIILPLTVPGIAAGAVFVFVLSIGNFITPDLLGGGKVTMVGNLIYQQFLSARDWPFGAAFSVVLMAVMLALLFAQAVLANRRRMA